MCYRQQLACDDYESEEEQDPPAESVGESSSSQDQRRERERVGVDDPLEPGQVGGEPTLDARQRDVHDRDVEQQHEGRHTDGDQRPAAGVDRARLHERHHKKPLALIRGSPLTRPLPRAIASDWWPPSTGSTALKASTTWSDRSPWSGRSRTRSTRDRSARPIYSQARVEPARRRSPGSWPRR